MKWHIKMRKKRQFKTLRFYFDFIQIYTCNGCRKATLKNERGNRIFEIQGNSKK